MKSILRLTKAHGADYCKDSTLHGVRYVAEVGRPLYEKLLWFIIIGISAVVALLIIFSSFHKFQTDPTITGVDVNFHDKILFFPSVFICPSDPVNQTKLNKTLTDFKILPGSQNYEDYKKFFLNLPSTTFESMFNLTIPDVTTFQYQQSVLEIIFSYIYSCNDYFIFCKFKDEEFDCCSSIFPFLTEHGFCYVYNNNLTAYNKKNKISYIFESDKSWKFEMLTTNINISNQIFLTDINGWIETSMLPQFQWTHSYTSSILVDIIESYNVDDVRALSLKQRKCIFSDQTNMMPDSNYKFNYDYSKCLSDCRKKKSQELCKCIFIFFSNINDRFRLCNVTQIICIKNNLHHIQNADCNCMKNCHHFEYKVQKTLEVSKVPVMHKVSDSVVYEELQDPDFNEVPFIINFDTWPMIRYKREVIFGWVDLLVSFGGIAGLFLGFSLLSAVEIIYYFSVRFYFTYADQKKKSKQLIKKNFIKVAPIQSIFTQKSTVPNFTEPNKIIYSKFEFVN